MGSFACTQCGGEFYIPLHSSFTCPNCNVTLEDQVYKTKAERDREEIKAGFGSVGEPIEYVVKLKDAPQIDNPLTATTPLEDELLAVMARAYALWRQRQEKYGPTNIASTGALGCVVRATDKIARLHEAYLRGRGTEMGDETIVDSWLDLLNYAGMGLLCEEGNWPGVEKK